MKKQFSIYLDHAYREICTSLTCVRMSNESTASITVGSLQFKSALLQSFFFRVFGGP